ncbi:MAG: class II aldolase/adducin family protein [Chloroflexota bacterium]|nr:class II aldolase/adducin family protein [Chloroflexota bacterium]MDE2949091.1 class II aldolase/adducin family protein [Chloroflexota bacterium]
MSNLKSSLPKPDAIMQVKQSLLANAKRAYEIRLQTGNEGNLSGRVPGADLIIIKASGCSFDQCTAENLVTVTLDGEIVDGDGMPSQELAAHLLIYKLRSDVQGVFHSHSPWAIACASLGHTIPTVTLQAKSKLGRIPVLRLTGETPQSILPAIKALLADDLNLQVFVQDRHGIFSFASSIELARYNAELVEETAQIAWSMALSEQLALNREREA